MSLKLKWINILGKSPFLWTNLWYKSPNVSGPWPKRGATIAAGRDDNRQALTLTGSHFGGFSLRTASRPIRGLKITISKVYSKLALTRKIIIPVRKFVAGVGLLSYLHLANMFFGGYSFSVKRVRRVETNWDFSGAKETQLKTRDNFKPREFCSLPKPFLSKSRFNRISRWVWKEI